MKGCELEFIVSSWTKVSRAIVFSVGVLLFGTLVLLWYRAEGVTKGPNPLCPPGRVIGEPAPAITLTGFPPPPTPTNPNQISPLRTPRPAPTALVFSLTKTIDLDPSLAYDAKWKLYVCKKDGTYVLLLARPDAVIGELPLENGDVFFRDESPKGTRMVGPPLPTFSAPVPTRTPTGPVQVKP